MNSIYLSLTFLIQFFIQANCYTRPCPHGWTIKNGYCYRVNKSTFNYSESKTYCKNYGGKLFMATTSADFNFAVEVSKEHGIEPFLDSVASSPLNFKWSDGSAINSSFWCPNEPNNFLSTSPTYLREGCVQMNVNDCLNDMPCWEYLSLLCVYDLEYSGSSTRLTSTKTSTATAMTTKKTVTTKTKTVLECPYGFTKVNQYCIFLNRDLLSQRSAQTFCQKYSAQLFIIRNWNDMSFLREFTDKNRVEPFLGAVSYQPLQFTWTDGSLINLGFWCPNEPNNHGGNWTTLKEGCIKLSDYRCLNDTPCSDLLPSVCEFTGSFTPERPPNRYPQGTISNSNNIQPISIFAYIFVAFAAIVQRL